MRAELTISQRQEQVLSPKMIQFYAMLQMPSLELEQLIEQELEANPALELAEEAVCPACGASLTEPICAECGYCNSPLRAEESEPTGAEPLPPYDFEPPLSGERPREGEETEDPIARLEAPLTLQEHLRWHFRTLTKTQEEWRIGQRLIGEIDDEGYFRGRLGEIAVELQVSVLEVERVLHLIQQLDPVGVGAQNLQECLLLQLDYLAEQKRGHALARRLVDECWLLFSKGKFAECARQLRVAPAAVQDAVDFIRENLNPYPGREFRLPWHTTPEGQVPTVRPEVVVRRNPAGDPPYLVEVRESPNLALRINRVYLQLWQEMQEKRETFSPQDVAHVREYVNRARQFIDNLNQRRATLKTITEYLVTVQREFLEQGIMHLKPLTRLAVARALGIHESTVGRAVAGKYLLLPSEEIVSFDLFFESALPAKKIIQHLIEHEDPQHPYSDDELVAELSARGFQLARRTVAKYRQELKILPYYQRKRLG